jgi:hypothetical protein
MIVSKNKRAEFKKISVKVQSRDESEELAVESRMLETTPSPPPKTIENKTIEVFIV